MMGGGRCEFVPQMIFLNFLFGYLCLLMVIKWVSGSTADLYHVMIYMFLQPGDGRRSPATAAARRTACSLGRAPSRRAFLHSVVHHLHAKLACDGSCTFLARIPGAGRHPWAHYMLSFAGADVHCCCCSTAANRHMTCIKLSIWQLATVSHMQYCRSLIMLMPASAQVLLVLIALVSVPIMLLPKPLILKKRHEKRAAQLEAYGRVSPTDADDEEAQRAAHGRAAWRARRGGV